MRVLGLDRETQVDLVGLELAPDLEALHQRIRTETHDAVVLPLRRWLDRGFELVQYVRCWQPRAALVATTADPPPRASLLGSGVDALWTPADLPDTSAAVGTRLAYLARDPEVVPVLSLDVTASAEGLDRSRFSWTTAIPALEMLERLRHDGPAVLIADATSDFAASAARFDPLVPVLSGPEPTAARIERAYEMRASASKAERERQALHESLRATRRDLDRALERLARAEDELQRQAHRDPVTGLLNRRGLTHELAAEVQKSRNSETALSALVLVLRGFSTVTRTSGHIAAEGLLQRAGALLVDSFRGIDVIARIDAAEFVVLLPETHRKGAAIAAERALERLTAGLGTNGVAPDAAVVGVRPGGDDVEGVLRRARALMDRGSGDADPTARET